MRFKRFKFQIFHLATDTQYEIPKKCLEVAAIRCPEKFAKPVVRPMFEIPFNEFRIKVSRLVKFVDDSHNVMIFVNGQYMLISKILEILSKESCPILLLNQPEYLSPWTNILFDNNLVHPERDYIFLNIHIKRRHEGFLIIEIFTDLNPKVAKGFLKLFQEDTITLGHYHVFKEGWLEFGIGPRMMPMRGHNHHPMMSHNRRGILSFCEEFDIDCDPFFIHFVPCTYFDNLRTVIGRVVHGDNILSKIEKLEKEFGKVEPGFLIYGCGIVPIGKNLPEDLDEEDWEKSINQLFGTKYLPSSKGDGDSESQIVCPLYEPPKDEASENISEPSSFSTPQTVQSWTDFDLDPITLHYVDDTPEYLSEQSTPSDISVDSGHSPKQSYDNELSLQGEFAPHQSADELICLDVHGESVSDISVKIKQCPSLGMDLTY